MIKRREEMILSKGLQIDLEKATEEAVAFIKKVVASSEASGIVIGLSGGVDSSVVATLCVRAVGPDHVLGVLMPTEFTPQNDISDASELAKGLSIKTELVKVQRITEAVDKSLGIDVGDTSQRIARANILARTRMVILYYYANVYNFLVVGTGDRSEYLVGYFTKYADGAADFFPIRHLYKTQIRQLGEHLTLPAKLAYKPSSPQLYPGHKLLDELPLDYDKLDPILVGLYHLHMQPAEISEITNVPLSIIESVQARYRKSQHKRRNAPALTTENRRG